MDTGQVFKHRLVQQLQEKLQSKGFILIGTHNGKWHADECISIAILRHALDMKPGQYRVIRTRDVYALNNCDIVVDAGGGKFDHHTTVERYPNGIPMASCGKVLRAVETDRRIINQLNRQALYCVQALDNGERDLAMRLGFTNNPFSWVGIMNPTFERLSGSDRNNVIQTECDFMTTLDMTYEIYVKLRSQLNAQNKAVEIMKSLPTLFTNRILPLPLDGMPWKAYVDHHPTICGVIYKSGAYWSVCWTKKETMGKRLHLFPQEWCGMHDKYNVERFAFLARIGCVFCHNGGHLAKFTTRDGAIKAIAHVLNGTPLQ